MLVSFLLSVSSWVLKSNQDNITTIRKQIKSQKYERKEKAYVFYPYPGTQWKWSYFPRWWHWWNCRKLYLMEIRWHIPSKNLVSLPWFEIWRQKSIPFYHFSCQERLDKLHVKIIFKGQVIILVTWGNYLGNKRNTLISSEFWTLNFFSASLLWNLMTPLLAVAPRC